jgi:ATP-dependent DNA ligase
VSVAAPDRGLSSRVCPLPPSGPGWLHEIKHDGFRILARKDAAGVKLITRAGNDFSSRFPFIAMTVGKLPVRSCLIDGEAIVCDHTFSSAKRMRVPMSLNGTETVTDPLADGRTLF